MCVCVCVCRWGAVPALCWCGEVSLGGKYSPVRVNPV